MSKLFKLPKLPKLSKLVIVSLIILILIVLIMIYYNNPLVKEGFAVLTTLEGSASLSPVIEICFPVVASSRSSVIEICFPGVGVSDLL